jgi:hypothetical protein
MWQSHPNLAKWLCALSVSTLLSSCSSWHLANSMQSKNQVTVDIPYVQGDSTGALTSRLVEAVSMQPSFRVDESGQYVLRVSLLDTREEKIGFRYDPKKLKHGKEDLILSETRAEALAEVSLVDRYSNERICGPAYILGNIEYDHQENTIDNNINDLSLGQLSDIDTAQDVTYIPQDRDLAHKISLWLQNQRDLTASASNVPCPAKSLPKEAS